MFEINIKNKEQLLVKSFGELTDSQKQDIAKELLRNNTFYNMTVEVEYILQKSCEYYEAPFTDDDIENNEPTGYILINGCSYELTEEQRDTKLELYVYLQEKADGYLESIRAKIDNSGDFDECEHLGKLEDKAFKRLSRLEGIIDELEGLIFDDYPEVMHWFLCPDLCYFLAKRGEVVLNGKYWGRRCCGQSIALDNVIQEIAFDVLACEI